MPNDEKSGIASWKIALLSTFLGTVLVFIPQLILDCSHQRTDKNQKLITALTECERISYLIYGTFKELNRYKVHKNYFARIAEICANNKDKKCTETYQKRHTEANQENMQSVSKITELNSEYLKNVAVFRMYIGDKKTIREKIDKIILYTPPKAAHFDSINNSDSLYNAATEEESKMNDKVKEIYEVYQSINSEISSGI
jgi:hypothetical protein